MSLVRRLPKFGFTNPNKIHYQVVNLNQLNAFDDGAEVTPESLFERRLARRKNVPVKILGKGELTKKLTVKAHKFSKTAVEQIKSKGGAIEVVS